MSSLRHIRSSVESKRPAASGLTDGQLALNTASGTPGLFFRDTASGVVKIGPAHVGTSAPNSVPAGSAGNSVGEFWVDNGLTTNGLKYWNGSAFVNLTPSGTTDTIGLVELATVAETQAGTDGQRAVTPSGLQSKISDSVSTTSSTTIASSTAVKTAYDLASIALSGAGGTVTGELLISPSGSLVFEGSSDDNFETTLAVSNPTADRTITLPNITGTLITTGDTGTVTSTMIADGAIVNADINASAAIVDTKLATISTAGKVANSATTATNANNINTIVLRDGSGNFSAGTITAALNGNASTVTNGVYTNNEQTITGRKIFNTDNTGMANGTGGLSKLEVIGTGGAAFMGFHRPNAYASYFGIDTDNQWKVGGWSAGGAVYPILHSGNYTTYAPQKDGVGASGTWGINVTGSAGSTSYFLNGAYGTNEIKAGNGDNATFATYNLAIRSWYGIGFPSYDGGNRLTINTRDGRIYSNSGWDTYGRNYSRELIEFTNYSGLYSAINGAHFYPNNASYGSWRISGTRNGWHGIHFDSNMTLMMNDGTFGFHREGVGWYAQFTPGKFYGTAQAIDGNIIIGAYSGSISATNRRISAESGILFISNDDNTEAQQPLSIQRSASNGSCIRFIRGTTRVGGITIDQSSTNYSETSDYRLKENVRPLTNAINRLQLIPVHRFNFIATPDQTVDGFLAHEVQDIVPQAITGVKDEMEAVGIITDAEGNVIEEDAEKPSELKEGQQWTQTGERPVYQGIDQSKLVPLLTAALQEAIEKIQTLEIKVASLENAS